MKKMKMIESILVCPECGGDLDFSSALACRKCMAAFVRVSNRFHFLERSVSKSRSEWLDRLKEGIRRIAPGVYPALVQILSPVFFPRRIHRDIPPEGHVVLNLGSGTTNFGKHVINVDLADYENVDVVASLDKLPIRSNSADYIVNVAVLEHVPNPRAVVSEFHRILRPNGRGLCFVPFIQGFHASPYDFQRYTNEGLKILFADFVVEKVEAIGPTSALVWIFQEWLALTFSFGSSSLYKILVPITWLLSPIKYFDFILNRHKDAKNIATGFFVEFAKPEHRLNES